MKYKILQKNLLLNHPKSMVNKMNNKDAVKAIIKRVIKFNNSLIELTPYDKINIGFAKGRGFFIRLGNNFFAKDRNIQNKRLFINAKNYTEIGFLLNRYEISINRDIHEVNVELFVEEVIDELLEFSKKNFEELFAEHF